MSNIGVIKNTLYRYKPEVYSSISILSCVDFFYCLEISFIHCILFALLIKWLLIKGKVNILINPSCACNDCILLQVTTNQMKSCE